MSSEMFQDVIGHEAAKRVLALACSHPHHAYLLTGPHDVGMYLLAERFVRALAGHDLAAPLTSHPDIAVLTREESSDEKAAASTISVESVRAFRERMARRPAIATRMIAYVPEADRLNDAGMNALLKSIEEPAAGGVYVFVAHDESRIPATIKSRTARLALNLVPSKEIKTWLRGKGIAGAKLDEALDVAEGRPGRALEWIENSELRAAYQSAAHTVERLLSASSAGEAFAVLAPEAKRCEGSDDPQHEWRITLERWSSLLRHSFVADASRALHLGQTFALAMRYAGGPVSPRIWLEMGLVRHAAGEKPLAPSHLPATFPFVLENL